MERIDLKRILNVTQSPVYANLVTRSTGRAVRGRVEEELAKIDPEQLAVIDFGQVNCLDFSCADEIVAKLLLSHGTGRYFLLKGVSGAHIDAIEAVLERHGLATVAEDRSGEVQLLGPLNEIARQAFGLVMKAGSAGEQELLESLDYSPDSVKEALDELCSRHLIFLAAASYQPLTSI
jgi:hypothetical protein